MVEGCFVPNSCSFAISGMMMNASLHNQGLGSALDNSSSVLIQNATLPTPPPMNGNITDLNNTGMLKPEYAY